MTVRIPVDGELTTAGTILGQAETCFGTGGKTLWTHCAALLDL